MELIPILSTIILVATISTFLLAIGAYILYKVRESKGQQVLAPVPATVRAELVTPAEVSMSVPVMGEQLRVQQPIYIEQQPAVQYQTPKQVFVQAPQFVAQPGYAEVKNYQTPVYAPAPKADSKFLKYTSEGYVSATAKEEKNSGALKWK